MVDDKTKRGTPDRNLINMHEDYEVKYWTRHFGVTKPELERVVERVGNSAAAVAKELERKPTPQVARVRRSRPQTRQ